ncbi:AzlD domain-containing protein [Salipaludibacillus aurantiacus]|uniref:Branched-chain amino acid transport protein n=1 Tax=Salipaludibacillus aurantiacus TaxID=1601833 RepID=A0A1H9TAC4_9BACI|nr:AzlD domain-containing protein [Salipaludibacillus aurantiacus]SER94172.1 Branched-chain amino acid transport protein [Salipaludibacillus aurantiacus]
MNMTMLGIIIGMGIVTYIPRLLPLLTLQTENWPGWSRRMLARVPYAVLGALIFPGVLYIHDSIWFGIAGGAVAVCLAYLGAPLIAVVGGSIIFLAVIQLVV